MKNGEFFSGDDLPMVWPAKRFGVWPAKRSGVWPAKRFGSPMKFQDENPPVALEVGRGG
jgi:hypothetical protein